MTAQPREALLAETFVVLADSMVVGYDVVDLLHTLVERSALLFDAADAGIILADPAGELGVIASTSERTHLIELMQLREGEGPCVEAYLRGVVVSVPDLASVADRWPLFADRARELGYASIHSIPLRLRKETIGALNLFREREGELSDQDVAASQAMADVATIGILQERAFREADLTEKQLRHALESRITIEQAKGVVAHTRQVDMDEAFRLIRTHARANGELLEAVARAIVDRHLQI
ncbi:MAG: GAF and ANTAR domain-containing protein [Pseudolysinimonas sp.]